MEKSLTPSDINTAQTADKVREPWRWYHLLPLVAIASFMFTPILTWRLPVPGAIRWVGDIAVALMLMLAVARMFSKDRIPGLFLAILALSILGFIMAFYENQHPAATLWGWWTIFRYPLVGLFVYMTPKWPKSFARNLPKLGVLILSLQLALQLLFFATGMQPGDRLAGTFGRSGTGSLILMIMLFWAIALGRWVVLSDWRTLVATIVLGSASSVLGEMKLFAIGAPLLAVMALAVHFLRRGQIRRTVIFIILFALAAGGFVYGYNKIVAEGVGRPRLETLLDEDKLERYDTVRQRVEGSYYLGRSAAGEFAWHAIQRDLPTTLFGMGLGTAQIATTFGLVGSGFDQSNYGVLAGATSLLIIMQETGVVGLLVIGMLMLLTTIILFRASIRTPDGNLDVIRIGIVLYTLLWPLWLWYNSSWFLSTPALTYWVIWGYIMQYSIQSPGQAGA